MFDIFFQLGNIHMFQFFLVWLVVVNKYIIYTCQNDEEVCINQFCQTLGSEVFINNRFDTSQMSIVFFDDGNTATTCSYDDLTII
ncbi:Uncharacterised protein [Mycobacterium tuberculosis]|uniref:Transmembrane protein n=1 Tax=Mycobacterium tuberculosis TaxID=1773 RepID=A0A655AW19_MYCTX|nr:Uncharacterised protein [Mycobacterium tuberculosis]